MVQCGHPGWSSREGSHLETDMRFSPLGATGRHIMSSAFAVGGDVEPLSVSAVLSSFEADPPQVLSLECLEPALHGASVRWSNRTDHIFESAAPHFGVSGVEAMRHTLHGRAMAERGHPQRESGNDLTMASALGPTSTPSPARDEGSRGSRQPLSLD
jgi:hypothetical protein